MTSKISEKITSIISDKIAEIMDKKLIQFGEEIENKKMRPLEPAERK